MGFMPKMKSFSQAVSPSSGSKKAVSKYGSAKYGTGVFGRRALRNPEKFTGIIADVPDIEMIREDGEVFSYDDVQSLQLNMIRHFIEVTGGRNNRYPIAYIDTGKEITFNFESAYFGLDLFENTFNLTQEEGDFGMVETQRVMAIKSDNATADKYGTAVFGTAVFGKYNTKVVLPFECKIGSINVRGLVEGETPAPGVFSVYITRADNGAGGQTVVYFHYTDVEDGDMIRVVYQRRVVAAQRIEVGVVNQFSICEFYSHWPSYTKDGVIAGLVHLYIPRCRVTQGPDFANKYKSHAPMQLAVAAMPPTEHQTKWFDIVFEPADEKGNMVTTTSNNVEWY